MLDDSEELQQGGYWPSVSDLFLSLFIVTMVITATLYYVLLPKRSLGDDRPIVEAVGTDLRRIRDPVNAMRQALDREKLRSTQSAREVVDGLGITSGDVVQRVSEMKEKISALENQIKSSNADKADLERRFSETEAALNDKPPIIRIDETTKEYRFASGSAVMDDAFRASLKENQFSTLASEILKRNGHGRTGVDTLEIIGHTDGQPVRSAGNLDNQLPDFLAGKKENFESLRAGSNNDLGLLRAVAVKLAWEDFVATRPDKDKQLLQQVEVRCYSAGQTIPPEMAKNRLLNPDAFREQNERSRRIEVRLTKLKDIKVQ
jgi:flagellar motor protein MotB